MEYLIILYYIFLAPALWLLVASANRVHEIDIKPPGPVNILYVHSKCPNCGNTIAGGAIKCGHCAALINFLR